MLRYICHLQNINVCFIYKSATVRGPLSPEGGCAVDVFYLADNPKKSRAMSYQGFNSITNYLTLAPWFLEQMGSLRRHLSLFCKVCYALSSSHQVL